MLANQAAAVSMVQLLPAASRSAGAANGSWLPVSGYQGHLMIVVNLGAVTGNVVVKLEDATSDGGAGAADVPGTTSAALSTANATHRIVLPAGSVRSHLRIVATVTTGPVLCSATLLAHPQYAG